MCAEPPEYVPEMLSESALDQSGYFDPAKVLRLTTKCRQQDGRLVSERENMPLSPFSPPNCWTTSSSRIYQFIRVQSATTPCLNDRAIGMEAVERNVLTT
jgi:hypothetical protein